MGRDLAIGLSLGVLTHQFTHQLSRRDRAPDRVVVVPAPSHGTRYSAQEAGWYESDARDAFPAGCMQVREYQTVVIIGGEEKDAYGQACLMPDGNWIQGPPTVEPEFN